MNKDELIRQIYDGVRGIARKQAYDQEQAKDFLQDGLIAALEAIDKYPDKSSEELVLIIAKSAYNKIYSSQSRDITYSRRYPNSTDNVLTFSSDDSVEEYENQDFLMVLMSRLSRRERRILEEQINPSEKTLSIVAGEKKDKLKLREKGQLVMNIHNDKVTHTHIAKSLGISKATVSRGFRAIQREAEALSDDQLHEPE